MTEESIVFSPWVPWSDRAQINGARDQGVYLLAHFDDDKVPTGPASPLDNRLVYIGETHGQTLIERWSQFSRSAQTGVRGHAGGVSYRKKFGAVSLDLYVAVFSPQPSKSTRCRSFFILFVEAKLVWEFSRANDPDQLCNKH